MPSASSDSPQASPSKGRTFLVRLGSTVVLWTLFTLALVFKLNFIIFGIIAVFGTLSAWEYFKFQKEKLDTRIMNFMILLSIGVWGTIGWQSISTGQEHAPWVDILGLTAAVIGAFLIVFSRHLEGEKTLLSLFAAIFGFIYTTWLGAFLSRLLFFNGSEHGAILLLMVILVTKFGDMGAYVIGSAFGKKKMIPHISPGKSWVGFYGAYIGSISGMVLLMWLLGPKLAPLTWTHALILAPILCSVGVVGDLAESVLKRCYQVKDSGHTLPGIGGVLDLTDSLLFTAPVAYLYLRHFA